MTQRQQKKNTRESARGGRRVGGTLRRKNYKVGQNANNKFGPNSSDATPNTNDSRELTSGRSGMKSNKGRIHLARATNAQRRA